ncbi:MAG: hypothetical protein WCF57_00405 [Pyrinomonadaceae bacterium]
MSDLDETGRLDHIIDAIVDLQDRQEHLENAFQDLASTLSGRIANLENRVSALDDAQQRIEKRLAQLD